jgi:hypothetical protein
MIFDQQGTLHVLDSYNHRVQSFAVDKWDWAKSLEQDDAQDDEYE